jgi:putative serine protease PepD
MEATGQGTWRPDGYRGAWLPSNSAAFSPADGVGPRRATVEATGSRRTLFAGVVAAALLAGAGGAAAGSLATTATLQRRLEAIAVETARGGPAGAAPAPAPVGERPPAGPDLAALYQQVAPAVVAVQAAGREGGGAGSGFVVDDRGHIVTNHHVVQGATQVNVQLRDGTSGGAQVVASDARNDLAVLRAAIPADRLKAVRLGDSDTVRPGEPAVALGSPFGFEHSITAGIVSAVDRESGGRRPITGLIQTDAAINPGNSGGPLLNGSGEVIGVASMGVSPVRGSVGVGFAVPVNAVRHLLDQVPGGVSGVVTDGG